MIETTLGQIIVMIFVIIFVASMVTAFIIRDERGYWNLVFWCLGRMLIILFSVLVLWVFGYAIWSFLSVLFSIPIVLS